MMIKKQLAEVCRKVYAKGFVAAYDGNLSARLPNNRIVITPSAKCKGEVEESDLLEVDLAGNLIYGSGKISTEAKIHLLAYSRRKEVGAVIHCHPVYSTAFAAAGEGITKCIFPEVILTLGKVPLCKYGTPSTEELTNSLLPYIDHSWAMLLENHGAVTLGTTIMDAYYKMEKLEHTAQVLFITRMLGGENPLTKEKVGRLYDIAEKTYGIKVDPLNRCEINFEESPRQNSDESKDILKIIKQSIEEILHEKKQ